MDGDVHTGCDLGTTRCHRAETAEAALQRVRDACDTWLSDGAAWAPYSARVILNALDGDGDE